MNIMNDNFSENEIYSNQLLRQKRGFPLHVPEPQESPAAFRARGVAIGDVGSLTPEGSFDFFFNIYLPADHPINDNDVPDDFCPLEGYSLKDLHSQRYGEGKHVSTASVQRLDPDVFPGGDFAFRCRAPQGAMLALPHGSRLQKLRHLEAIRAYATTNAVLHPGKLINSYIRTKVPEATVVISHDDDWRDILGDNDPRSQVQTVSQFLQRIADEYDIMEQDGATFLQAVSTVAEEAFPAEHTQITDQPSSTGIADLSATLASILQLVDLMLKIQKNIDNLHYAPPERQKLLSEVGKLQPLLEELRSHISANPASGGLRRMESVLSDFEATMQGLRDKLNPAEEASSKVSQWLAWTRSGKTDTQEYLAKFEQFKSLLNSSFLVDLWDMDQQHQRDNNAILQSADNVAKALNSGFTEMGEASSYHERQIDSDERTKIIEWLSPINFCPRHADISSTRQDGTGGWLLNDPVFTQWKSGAGSTLWCRGLAGTGKTVLASIVVDHLAKNKNTSVAYSYINPEQADQTPAKLLAALWRQLVLNRDIGSLATKLYQQHRKRRTPSIDEVGEVLRSVIEEQSRVFIVVDALDECCENDRLALLRSLAALGSNINVMVTSRPHISLDPFLFPNVETLDICAGQEDIRRYVHAQLQKSSRLSKHVQAKPKLEDEIIRKITVAAGGMFLLAKLHFESLSTKTTIKAVREALSHLPNSLDDTYSTLLQQIEEQSRDDREIARSTLIWVANAKRPLTVLELQTALAIGPDDRSLDEDKLLDIKIILRLCAGLVIVDEELSVVRLVHYTTQEYLDTIQAERFPDAQTEITRTLLRYLAFDGFPDYSWTRQPDLPPLLEYSQYCLAHAAGRPEGQLRPMIIKFLGRAEQWRHTMHSRWDSPPWNYIHWPQQPSELWVAAAANLGDTAKVLLSEEALPVHPDSPALTVASHYGSLEIVRLLLEHGSDISKHSRSNGTALWASSLSGHDHVVGLLLDKGADVNAHGGGYGSALWAALSAGHTSIVQLLLEKGADPNAHDGENCSALATASFRGHASIVQLLLEKGADADASGEEHGDTIDAASQNGHAHIILREHRPHDGEPPIPEPAE
ncbi:hypothetical protein B0H16DRAFT_1885008 [Mycena metata]|uniref:NACHT domain-containing protein n=1 Tax=Mycena metata TaxID=1033252 RepID=A0AAD7J8S6_9AGAR|nr:hypothetical protein B0H16DRAFT_1885008 [Mycena metata]